MSAILLPDKTDSVGLEEPRLESAIVGIKNDFEAPDPHVMEQESGSRQVTEQASSSPQSTLGDELYLEIRPCSDPAMVFRFCQSVQTAVESEIVYFSSSLDGIIIRLALRKPVPILKVLTGMEEVYEATQEEIVIGKSLLEDDSLLNPIRRIPVRITLNHL